MKSASRRRSAASTRAQGDGWPANDPHDAIDRHLLTLWLGLSQLREELRRNGRRGRAMATGAQVANVKAPAVKRMRRKAA